jgi:hypothetical protein
VEINKEKTEERQLFAKRLAKRFFCFCFCVSEQNQILPFDN